MEGSSKSFKLTPEGKCAFLDQALRLIVLQNGNARKFLQLMSISKSFKRCAQQFPIYSLGLQCSGVNHFHLFISTANAFEENCERAVHFKEMSYDQACNLISQLNPRKFIASFSGQFWWNKNADVLSFVNAPIDMICNVNSNFMLGYQLTPFWRFNLRRLKFDFRGYLHLLQIGSANAIIRAINYEDANKSDTLEHVEIFDVSVFHVKSFIDSLKLCCPKLKSLKVKERKEQFVDRSIQEVLESVNNQMGRVRTIKGACINWIARLDLEINLIYMIDSKEGLRKYVRALQQIEAFRNVELEEIVDETGISKCMLKLKEQDSFSDTSFQVTIRHGGLQEILEALDNSFVSVMRPLQF